MNAIEEMLKDKKLIHFAKQFVDTAHPDHPDSKKE